MGLEAERKAEAECAQGSATEPAFGGLPVAKSKSLSSLYHSQNVSPFPLRIQKAVFLVKTWQKNWQRQFKKKKEDKKTAFAIEKTLSGLYSDSC